MPESRLCREVEEAPKKEKASPESLLMSASLAGDVSTVQTLLSTGVSVNHKGDKDYTALHNSTRNGHTVSLSSSLNQQGRLCRGLVRGRDLRSVKIKIATLFM